MPDDDVVEMTTTDAGADASVEDSQSSSLPSPDAVREWIEQNHRPDTAAEPAAASGGDTPAGPDAQPIVKKPDVPYERLEETARRAQVLEEKLTQYAPLDPWRDIISQLQAQGFTPEAISAQIQAAATAPEVTEPEPVDPAVVFHEWLGTRGHTNIDQIPDDVYEREWAIYNAVAPLQQTLQQIAQQNEQAQRAALGDRWKADFASIHTDIPELNRPVFTEALCNLYEGRYGDTPNATQLAQTAREMMDAVEDIVKARLADYAAGKQKDSAVPAVSGGVAPAPTQRLDYHNLSPEAQQQAIQAAMEARQG